MAGELAIAVCRLVLEYSLALRAPIDTKKPRELFGREKGKHLAKSSVLEKEKRRVRMRERIRERKKCGL